MSKTVRLGLIGLGGMGQFHAANILAGKIARLELTAVADKDQARTGKYSQLRAFPSISEMAASGTVDAVLIATPHYQHTPIALEAIRAGLHVMVEKPIAVHKSDAEHLLAEPTRPGQIIGAMFNQRTDDYYIQIRELIRSGELGEVRRVNWIITDWFRTFRYYGQGGWRATWAGEGGGVLLNQCPHNLDLLQWLCGMPVRVRAFCNFGRYHPIEVEDDVTAYLEFANGATGVFVTSTGEAPGTNRLEITAERGRVVYEGEKIHFLRNDQPMSEFSRTSPEAFSAPAKQERSVPAKDHGGQHVAILQNFVAAILDGTPLIAPAAEGIKSLELANAMLLSTWTGETISLPLDGPRYAAALNRKIAESPATRP
jgi:predicted dehydrogenase